MNTLDTSNKAIKWPEIFSLAALNAAIAISWIAYHEYQPIILEEYKLTDLLNVLVFGKAAVLVTIPPIAGYFADRYMKRLKKGFVVYIAGITITAMIFMIVATLLNLGKSGFILTFLPVMIVLWLISMNIFISPATSMLNSFSSLEKMPIALGIIVLLTDIIYAAEPVIDELVGFFGDTLTFVVGGVLISVTGYLFYRVSSNEIANRSDEMRHGETDEVKSDYFGVIGVGLLLGVGRALIVEYIPTQESTYFLTANYFSFILLGAAALAALLISKGIARWGYRKAVNLSIPLLGISALVIWFGSSKFLFMASSIVLAGTVAIMSVSFLPLAFSRLNKKHISLGVGLFIGASAVFEGILEILKLYNLI